MYFAFVGARIDNVWVTRIGRDITAFAAADGIPIRLIYDALIAAAGDAYGGVVLLRAVEVIRKSIVRGHVIELRGWVVVFRGPSLAAVDGNRRPAIIAQNDSRRIIGIDPKSVIISMGCVDYIK